MSEREEQQAMADVQALCAKHGRLVMLRVMGRLQFQWARQGLAVLGTEAPTETETAPQRVAPGKETAKPAAALVGKVMNKLEGRNGEGR